ncbi:hypothetical protein CC86DRAFT_179572 [Ophiobolus disseminans]|uniref:Uncharacterized protein n=1 Tax=Ophiobolus disseminans TaxID=1469910 RepID=A0A6A7ABF4_9PLEO|nr:hypothetical protein CC86DRAFT_179572 [Ophiobolus disseminans]
MKVSRVRALKWWWWRSSDRSDVFAVQRRSQRPLSSCNTCFTTNPMAVPLQLPFRSTPNYSPAKMLSLRPNECHENARWYLKLQSKTEQRHAPKVKNIVETTGNQRRQTHNVSDPIIVTYILPHCIGQREREEKKDCSHEHQGLVRSGRSGPYNCGDITTRYPRRGKSRNCCWRVIARYACVTKSGAVLSSDETASAGPGKTKMEENVDRIDTRES